MTICNYDHLAYKTVTRHHFAIVILTKKEYTDGTESGFGIALQRNEVRILIFDDPAEEKRSQRPRSGFSPARVLLF